MNSNIVKKGISSTDMNSLFSLFCPTKISAGNVFEGQSVGRKKSLKIMGTNPDKPQQFILDADGRTYSIPIALCGFINSAEYSCGDSIVVDDTNQKVYLYKNIFEFKLADFSSRIGINNIYDTHSTFQINTQTSFSDNPKKKGVTNLYSKDFITHKKSSPTIFDSGIVGSESTGFIYIKIKADDENYFYNGERITQVEQLRKWIAEKNTSIYYETENPVITDITHTIEGKLLLELQPQKEYLWNIYDLYGEMCVYCHIDNALAEVSAMILD